MSSLNLDQQKQIASLHEQAQASLQAGDVPVACQLWQAVLRVHPEDELAQQYLAHFAAPTSALALDQDVLDLDEMDAAAQHPVGAAPSTQPQPVAAQPQAPVALQAAPVPISGQAVEPVAPGAPRTTQPNAVQADAPVPGLVHQIEAEDTSPPPGLVAGIEQVDHTAVTQQPKARTHVTQEVQAIPIENLEPIPLATTHQPAPQTPAMPRPDLSRSIPAASQAGSMVHSAQQALDSGDLKAAIDMASRAMAMSDDHGGADEILAEAQARADELAAASEGTFNEAMAFYEQGQIAQAAPLFQRTLEIWPDHADAMRFLDRCQAASAAPIYVASPDPADAETASPTADGSIPLQSEEQQSARFDEPALDEDAPPFEVPSLQGLEQENFAAVAAAAATDAADDFELPDVEPEAEPESAEEQAKPKKKAKTATARKSPIKMLVSALGILAGIAIGYYAVGYFLGGEAEPADDGTVTASAGLRQPGGLAPAPENGTAPEPVAQEPGDQEPGDREPGEPQPDSGSGETPVVAPEPPPPPPKTTADVPGMLKLARKLMGQGREPEAVEILTEAQALSPSNFEVIDELSRARKAAGKRLKAQGQIDEGRRYFEEGNYSEALRLFYRVPQEYKPRKLNRWIADGWYNIGVQSLQTGQVLDAYKAFGDALGLDPRDVEAQKHQEVARRYRGRDLDDAYSLYAKQIRVRGLR